MTRVIRLGILAIALVSVLIAFGSTQTTAAKEAGMGRVVGIGGVFFKSKDPKALAAWYRDKLGIEITEWGGAIFPLSGRAGPKSAVQVWSPFKHDTDYFAPSHREFMIDFQVDDLDAMCAQLKAKGVAILKRDDDSDPSGRFAWIVDPDGTKIELWQPK